MKKKQIFGFNIFCGFLKSKGQSMDRTAINVVVSRKDDFEIF